MTENNPLSLEQPMALLEAISQLILNKMPTAEYSSLLNDFVESEFFLIDGDSLLITCICEKSLKQGQSLHFFYLVECYLLDLINKGGHFAVVFFKDAEYAYFSFPELLPLRTALILHLQKNTTVDVWTEFSRCFSPEWQTCLKETCPYFLIVADEGLNQLQTHLFNFLIIHCWAMRVNIVLFSGQASDILRLYAYFMPSLYDDVKLLSKNRTQIWTVYKSLLKQLEENRTSAVATLFRDLKWDTVLEKASEIISLLKKIWPERSDVQRVFCVTSCSLFLQINHDFLPKKKKAISSKNNNKQQGSCLGLAEMKDFCKLHCLTMAFLLNLPLPQRACSRFITAPWIKAIQTLFKMKKWCDYFILSNKSLFRFWDLNSVYLSDLTDDVLLKNIAFYYENENADGLHLHLGKTIMKDYEYLWNTVSKLVRTFDVGKPFPLRTSKLHFLKKKLSPIKESSQEKMPKLGFIPMSSKVIDEFVGDILKDLPFLKSDDPIVMSLVKQKEFDELVHWHSHRPLSDDYDRTKANFNANSRDPHILKSLQKYHIFQRLYGNSLESVSSKLIVTQGVKAKKDCHEAKSKKKHETKAELIAKENKKRLLAKEEQKEEQKWNALSLSIEEEMKKNLNSGIKKLEDFLKSCKSNSVKVQGEMVGLMACLKTWKEHCKAEGKIRKDLSIVVQMMKRIQSLVDKYSELLQEADWKFIAKCLKYLRFDELASSLYPTQDTDDINKKKKSKYSVGIGPARFQLQYMGHYLVREERKDPDPRVQDFIPDTWQRELLDVVDNYESAVIVAPTSSGKTYASYYCMERVLKESDEGVVVYVAPTKALVNQVAATVQHRYTKNLPSGEALCGVFTREYRHDALNCQVLVTVPACFEILLLAPHRQQWVKRIRYVIFDEVHCLGGEIGAEIWEHLLVMIRCPFLALSATISNPERLVEWLQSTRHYWKKVDSVMKPNIASETKAGYHAQNNFQVQQSHKVRLVLYGERYNDLEKYICSVKNDDICFDHYHPCAALTTDHIERYGFPSDLALSPRESLQLYDTMSLIWKEWPQAQNLCPENFIHFKNKVVIKKSDARKYEESLKSELTSWVKDGNIKQAKKVLKHLNPHSEFRSGNLLEKFPLLVEKLSEMNQLPAIFFIFSLKNVEMCAESVGKSLEKKQEEKRSPKADKEAHVMVSKLQKFKKSMEKQKIVEGKKQQKTRKLDQSLYHEAQYNHLLQSLEENLKMPQDCTYADYKVIDSEYLQMVFNRVKFERKGDQLKALARRGVGYHYSAMSAKEKQLVEILFRKGFIRVVTATGTLALGINMPCKSVVFAQNSVYLDALNYRQMSGRAGRRGQDLLGNVYFFDIPQPKVEKLIKSKVPELRGQFPFSITLILRLLLLASKADDQEDGQAKVLSVLKHSLLSFKQPKIMEILKLYFLFTLQFLVKEGYIDRDGNPTGFAGLVSHLHYHEPSNLVFVNFLVNGLFHKLCQPTKKGSKRFSEDTMQKLVLVLANLFGRRFLPAKLQDADTKFYQSKVFLEKLPTDFKAALEDYNSKVTQDFTSFLLIVSRLADMKQECELPLSKTQFIGQECADSPLVAHLMNCTQGRGAVSPFVSLSGNFDDDLLYPEIPHRNILRTLGISYAQAPLLLPQNFDSQGRRMPLNAYILDFYKHGSLKGLVQDNRINEGEAYNLLKDFSLTVKSISVSLRELCENEDDNVVLAFEQLSETFSEKFKKI
ncbi:probable ATP-dependent RNA helicase DDX60 [Dipodomys spectabilis]|uniref:probable ATP-dependent RNA helicase DDX60 n=1 Tax=Dipodomys spectabilis TaxID=105255 RepID=UPI001C53E98C|nr:probable ATP-dependent RNA helicase DDX60 [Dipodomys spectabilis]XP_042556916.1 probable ATP-dependent RNA helicase DDX60 [Dipodomys spectabilis]XP_042556925.1 probable ATP-dependent RNA helicase DDX60 [Dipodomys spectabilis]XP_042556927.1 probable ATP-dependent RNA helicase DDX60 [Dipodomys spectabilis]XP_042556928.1 probable ATP-dependent RNA helicase DDX60 [Dipodomys spectabilis]XP_042556930.1 probable ATP-dependent RNA helicase DDX60 [Dipodomys spectabilis]